MVTPHHQKLKNSSTSSFVILLHMELRPAILCCAVCCSALHTFLVVFCDVCYRYVKDGSMLWRFGSFQIIILFLMISADFRGGVDFRLTLNPTLTRKKCPSRTCSGKSTKSAFGMLHILPYIRPPLDNLELNANIA